MALPAPPPGGCSSAVPAEALSTTGGPGPTASRTDPTAATPTHTSHQHRRGSHSLLRRVEPASAGGVGWAAGRGARAEAAQDKLAANHRPQQRWPRDRHGPKRAVEEASGFDGRGAWGIRGCECHGAGLGNKVASSPTPPWEGKSSHGQAGQRDGRQGDRQAAHQGDHQATQPPSPPARPPPHPSTVCVGGWGGTVGYRSATCEFGQGFWSELG